jgi:hypothetical protein
MKLLKAQKNELFDLVANTGFSTSLFTLTEDVFPTTEIFFTAIEANGTGYRFTMMKTLGDDIHLIYCPAMNSIEMDIRNLTEWVDVKHHFFQWLQSLKRELQEPDKWEEAYKAAKKAQLHLEQADNELFTSEETKRIESVFADFRQQLGKASNLSAGQLRVVNAKLDYLMEKAKTLGKMDWQTLAMGTFLELMIQQTIPPDALKSILILLKNAMATIFQISL